MDEEKRHELQVIGIVGLGRLGMAVGSSLLEAGYQVACCSRGRSAALVERGGWVAGDGTPRAVADASDVMITCLPSDAVETAITGADGMVEASVGPPPLIEMSTAPVELKERMHDRLAELGSDLLDCPISGTPTMVESGQGVMYASGDSGVYSELGGVLRAVSPNVEYVGGLGAGTKMKYVANLLALVHVATAAEAMALAQAQGLDLSQVAEIVSASPAAVSGQFKIRAPMMAESRFDGALVTVRDAREVLGQVTSAAEDAGVRAPLAAAARDLLEEFGDGGEDDSDPGKLIQLLNRGEPTTDVPRLYIAMSRVTRAGHGPLPAEVLEEHLGWIDRLEATGKVVAAGPVVDDDAKIKGDGVYIVRAGSSAEAERLVAGDPMHTSGYRTCEVAGWEPHQGRIVLSAVLTDAGTALG